MKPHALACLMVCAAAAWSQSAATGGLEGAVKDPAGNAVPKAEASLFNPSTGESHTAEANDAGAFRFSLISPGAYDLKLSAAGFKTSRMTELKVNVSEVPIIEATLEPGDTAELVSCNCRVTAGAPSTGTLVDKKTITAVPLTTRNFTQVLSMSSGSVADVNNAGTLGRGSATVNVNGNSSARAYTIDGAWAPSTVPNPDAISEFKIQTSQYDAVFGAMVPSTNLVTKRGENEIHGDAWEFLRNDVFNANAFFRNATGQSKPNLKQNQFGATLGAPIKRNSMFLFGSYQGTLQVNGLDPTSVSNPILPGLTADRSAGNIAAQFCPGNHALSNGTPDARYLTFAGGKQLDCANRSTATTAPINPVALQLLQMKAADGSYLIPTPQTLFTSGTNAGLGFSSFSQPSKYNEHHYLVNGDYLLSPRNTIAGRFFGAVIDQLRTFGSPNGYPGAPVVPGFGANQFLSAVDAAGSVRLTSNLSSSTVNEATAAYTRSNSDTSGPGVPAAASVGMRAVDPLFPEAPEMTVLGPLGSFRLFGTNPNDNHFSTTTYSFADNISFVRGKQRIRVGGAFVNQYNGRADTGGARGKLTFQTFSDFLLGLSAADNLSPAGRSNIQLVSASEGVGPNGEVEYRYRRYYGAAFVQDDIKLSPTFTLNAGLRWEYVGPSLDAAGTIGNFFPSLAAAEAIPPATGTLAGNTVAANYDPNLVNPYTGKPFGPPPAGVLVRSSKGFYENGAPLDSFAPRAGFAWQPFGPKGRLVLGGGYGWFYQSPTFSANAGTAPLFSSPPFAQSFTNTDASNAASSLSNPFPATTLGFIPRTLTSQLSDRVAGPEYKAPRIQQWNVSAKVGLVKSMSLDLAYVGSKGDDLLRAHGLNQPVLATAGHPVNCGYDGVSAHCIDTNTSVNAKLRVPIMGETPTALQASIYDGSSWYQSVQVTLRKQMARGLTFQAAYTLSKTENDSVIYNDQNNLTASRARASFDRSERLIANFDYQIPSPRSLGRFGTALLHNWSAAGIIIVQSGLPMTLTDPNGGSVYGRAGVSTVMFCPGKDASMLTTQGSVQQRLYRWLDASAICPPPAIGADGATGYGNAGISIVEGPGQFNTDFSIGRRAKVGGLNEDAELAFRVEFYNALNHPQFANPGTTFGTATFGVITQSSVAPRLIQFGIKYLF